jgi:methylphosphotriester-DNA--protein-cysteine methyltransferase
MKKLNLFFLAVATLCFIGIYSCKRAAEKAKELEKEELEVVEEAVDTIEKAVKETPADTVDTTAKQEESDN